MTSKEISDIERDTESDIVLWLNGKLDWKDIAPDVGAKLEKRYDIVHRPHLINVLYWP